MLPEIRITVESTGERRYRSRVTNLLDDQAVCEHDFEYDPDLLVNIEAQGWLERGIPQDEYQAVRRHLSPPIPDAGGEPIARFGRRLYGYLFGQGAEFRSLMRFDPRLGQGRVRLDLALHPGAAVLWSVPWEYLHDSDGFLALSGRFLLSRVPWTLPQVRYEASPRPLRVLIAIAGPSDQQPLNQEREIEIIQEALDEAQGQGMVRMDFLDFATLDDLREALSAQQYDVLHFTGHGNWDEGQEIATLAFEDEKGSTDPVTLEQLRPLLTGRGLRLAVLSSCLGARTGNRDAFIGMGTGLLRAGVPAVLAMQSSILDASAIGMARALYTALGRGRCLEEALWESRQAMRNRRGGAGSDWGLPMLYLRTHEMRLIDPQAPAVEAAPAGLRMNVGGLPLPRGFVGRREELRAIQRSVEERVPFLFIWGLGGVGKTALAAKAIAKLDRRPVDGWAVVDCKQEHKPLADVLSSLANLLRGRGTRQTQLAEVLLDSSRDLADRVGLLAGNLPQTPERLLFVFDNLETQLRASPLPAARAAGKGEVGDFADPQWQEFFEALFRNNWRNATWLFTSRFRPRVLGIAAQGDRLREFHLRGLGIRHAVMFMGNLAHLRGQPIKDKEAGLRLVGGHPKTIELLDAWVGQGGGLGVLLADPALRDRLAEEWEGYFLGELLARLSDEERQALEAMSVWRGPFWRGTVEWMMGSPLPQPGEEPGPALSEVQGVMRALQRWHELSLVQLERVDEDGDRWYAIHPVVREYLLGQLTQPQRDARHLRAAEYYQERILDPVRDQMQPPPTPEQEPQAARDVLKQLAGQTQNMDRARWAVDRGLAWREHLFAARRYEEADDIVNAVCGVLNRWGQRDLAKALLRDSIASPIMATSKAMSQGNLATLLKDEGRSDEALTTYQDVYRTFEERGAKQQMAATLSNISSVHMDKGDYDRAIEVQQASLEIKREIGNEEGQVISLHLLSMLYRSKEDYGRALETSKEAEALNRRLERWQGIAANLHEQGIILNEMGQRQEAFACFQESLEIQRRIGNEAGAADSLAELGKLLMNAGQMQEAIAAFTEFTETHRRLGNPAKVGIGLECLGVVHEHQGEYGAALEKYQQAQHLYQQYYVPGIINVERHITRVRGKMKE